MSAVKNLGGRPLKFKTVKELEDKIDAYFAECDPHVVEVEKIKETRDEKTGEVKRTKIKDFVMTEQIPYTITGLALALDASRETLLEYEGEVAGREKKDPGYAYAVKKAKLRCQNFAEQFLFSGKHPTGAIFNLKNNHNWQDKSQVAVDHTTKGEKLGADENGVYSEFVKSRLSGRRHTAVDTGKRPAERKKQAA